MSQPQKRELIADIVIAWCPWFVIFVAIPCTVYLANQGEFDYRASVLAPFLLIAGALVFVTCALALLAPRWRAAFAIGLFYFGLFLMGSDLLAPVQLDAIDGVHSRIEIPEPAYLTLIEIIIASILALAAWRVPKHVTRALAVPFIGAIVLVQAITLYRDLDPKTTFLRAANADVLSAVPSVTNAALQNSGNIYHLVFDAYSSFAFMDAVKDLGLESAFEGFTFFANTRANYAVTAASVPSFLTATLFKEGSYGAWRKRRSSAGVIGQLSDFGYTISVYAPDKSYFHERTAFGQTNMDLSSSLQEGADLLSFLDLWAVRVAPTALQNEAFRSASNWSFSKTMQRNDPTGMAHTQSLEKKTWFLKNYASLLLMQRFMQDERARPAHGQYVYVHVLIPHAPFLWEKDCTWAQGWSTYEEQVRCATKLMGDFVAVLKQLGKYDNALIILQSDHGYHDFGPATANPEHAPKAVLDKITEISNGALSAEGYLRRTHPLLAIKPPAAANVPLRTSSVQAQLLDIPATIYDLVEIEGKASAGKSVYKLLPDESREIEMFIGLIRNDDRGRRKIFGAKNGDAHIGHIAYSAPLRWRVLPDIVTEKSIVVPVAAE